MIFGTFIHLSVREITVLHPAARVDGHVSLTFPPARDLNLDFLDSIRTPPPCGMPKGESKGELSINMLNTNLKITEEEL